jgi:hypothetical protein
MNKRAQVTVATLSTEEETWEYNPLAEAKYKDTLWLNIFGGLGPACPST